MTRRRTLEDFTGIVEQLRADDRGFARRVRHPADRRVHAPERAALAGLVVTILLGIVPLAVGVHTGVTALLVAGVVGCLAAPVALGVAARHWWL